MPTASTMIAQSLAYSVSKVQGFNLSPRSPSIVLSDPVALFSIDRWLSFRRPFLVYINSSGPVFDGQSVLFSVDKSNRLCDDI